MMVIKCSKLRKEEREKQNPMDLKAKVQDRDYVLLVKMQ